MILGDMSVLSATTSDAQSIELRFTETPLNTDTSLLRTVVFVPGASPYIFYKFNPDTR